MSYAFHGTHSVARRLLGKPNPVPFCRRCATSNSEARALKPCPNRNVKP